MRIKLGPFKISPELWRDIQELPGATDEQRVLMALQVAIAYVKDAKAKRAEAAKEIADTAAAEVQHEAEGFTVQGAPVVVGGGPVVHPLAGITNFEVGETITNPPPELLGFDPGPPGPPTGAVVVTEVDHEKRTITVKEAP